MSFEFFPPTYTTLVLPAKVTNSFVKEHPELIFVYSNDRMNKGCEGMSWHFAKEPNAFMVPTMNKMCHSATDKYFKDGIVWQRDCILEAIAKIPIDGRPIIPIRKMGMGCSRMYEFAPELYKFMWEELNKIATNVIWLNQS